MNCTDLQDLSSNNNQQLIVFPNPTKNELSIVNTLGVNAEIILSDALGKTVAKSILNENQSMLHIQIQHLEKGIYFLQFYSNSQLMQSQKIIKD